MKILTMATKTGTLPLMSTTFLLLKMGIMNCSDALKNRVTFYCPTIKPSTAHLN